MKKVTISKRSTRLNPFYVMDILARAKQLEAQGQSVIHLEVGEPDFATAPTIIEAGIRAMHDFPIHYTAATGLPVLRQTIADYYQRKFNVDVDASRIIITPGASGALQLALLTLLDAGDSVLLADPGYPCNRNIAQILAGRVVSVPVTPESDFHLTAELVNQYWEPASRAAIVATPSNPTGTLIKTEQLKALISVMDEKKGVLIVDEIYQGLVYDVQDNTALSLSDDCFIINSFSKYFGMTGWRLGWMVVPTAYVDAIDRISQNLFLAPSTIAQYAACEALKAETEEILLQRRDEFKKRRDFLTGALESIGFDIPVDPDGAFYIYAGCDRFTDDSFQWSCQMLESIGVAITPGADFGGYEAQHHCRFAYTRPVDILEQACERIQKFI